VAFDTRDVLIGALGYWGCAWREEERNLFRLEIAPKTPAAEIFEGAGTTHAALVTFEDDVIARYANWRSLAPGSYYLHRFLEYLQKLPRIGHTVAAAKKALEADEVPPPVEPSAKVAVQFVGMEETTITALVFRFLVRLIGTEPETELVSVAVESEALRVLPDAAVEESPAHLRPPSGIRRLHPPA